MLDLEQEMSRCRVCPRKCGADREHGKTGYCKALRGYGGAGGAAFLGRTVYIRDDGVRDGFLFRVQSAVCLLSEPSYCGDGERKSDFDRAAFGYFSGAAGAECE